VSRRLRAFLIGLVASAATGAASGAATYALEVLPQRAELEGVAHALRVLAGFHASSESCPCDCPAAVRSGAEGERAARGALPPRPRSLAG